MMKENGEKINKQKLNRLYPLHQGNTERERESERKRDRVRHCSVLY